MPLFSLECVEPVVSPTAWIAPTATLVGDVRVEDEASVLHGGGDPFCERHAASVSRLP
jgi:carbonic anhydrase/acetyltransferase-like protein (isoleucine patch superfamily)